MGFMGLNVCTYSLPSSKSKHARLVRISLPRHFDAVYGKDVRYKQEKILAAQNLLRMFEKFAQLVFTVLVKRSFKGSAYFVDAEILPAVEEDRLRRDLLGMNALEPTLVNQRFWAAKLAPELPFQIENNPRSTWELLQSSIFPFIQRYGTNAQQNGIRQLQLEAMQVPTLEELNAKLQPLRGWQLIPCAEELSPLAFFSLLAERKFPVVLHIRPLHGLFCSYEPDFWHEIIGHATLLCDPEFADFYFFCGKLALSFEKKLSADALRNFFQVLWAVLEYGILKTPRGVETFGAALNSSFIALTRLDRGVLSFRPFDIPQILDSGFIDGKPIRRTRDGKMVFFVAPSLLSIKQKLVNFKWDSQGIN